MLASKADSAGQHSSGRSCVCELGWCTEGVFEKFFEFFTAIQLHSEPHVSGKRLQDHGVPWKFWWSGALTAFIHLQVSGLVWRNNPVMSKLVSSTQVMDVSAVGRLKEAEGISKGGSALFLLNSLHKFQICCKPRSGWNFAVQGHPKV